MHCPRPRHGALPGLVALALAGAALLAAPASALAHANLTRSDPAANANLSSAPSQVRLWFTERPEPRLTEIQVLDQQRRHVEQGPPLAQADDPLALAQPVQPGLGQGVYTVSWRTTSAVDGHVTAGAFAFGVGVAPSPVDLATTITATPPPSIASVVIRWASYTSLVGLAGLLLFPTLILIPAQDGGSGSEPNVSSAALGRAARRCWSMAAGLAALGLVAGVAMLGDQVWRSTGSLSPPSLQVTLTTGLGITLTARLLVTVALLALLLARVRTPLALVPLALAQLLLVALSGHAAGVADSPDLLLFLDWAHLALASVWVGGLIALSLLLPQLAGGWRRPGDDVGPGDVHANQVFAPILGQFSRVALVATAGLALTGLYQAVVEVGTFDNLVSTPYGRSLLVKAAIFAVALLLAAFHRFTLKPALLRPARVVATRARRLFQRSLPLEAALAIAVLAATGVLTSQAPASSAAGSAPTFTRSAGDLRVVLKVEPLQAGPNQFAVILTRKGKPVIDADKVELRFDMLDMDMGESVMGLQNAGNGTYQGQSSDISMPGHWRIQALIRLPGELDQRLSFDVDVKR